MVISPFLGNSTGQFFFTHSQQLEWPLGSAVPVISGYIYIYRHNYIHIYSIIYIVYIYIYSHSGYIVVIPQLMDSYGRSEPWLWPFVTSTSPQRRTKQLDLKPSSRCQLGATNFVATFWRRRPRRRVSGDPLDELGSHVEKMADEWRSTKFPPWILSSFWSHRHLPFSLGFGEVTVLAGGTPSRHHRF